MAKPTAKSMVYFKEPEEMRPFIWKGLNPVRFPPLAVVLPKKRAPEDPVVIMREANPNSVKPWCIEYRGSGRYYGTLAELSDYCKDRWGFSAETIGITEEDHGHVLQSL